MQNFFQPANTINLVAPTALNSGAGFFVGKIFGIATITVAAGAIVPAVVEGAVTLKKAGGYSPAVGADAVFDVPSQTLISGAGTAVGLVIASSSPDDATYAVVKLIPVV